MSSLNSSRLLEGQVAIITGGASGIGAAAARVFTNHGARVVIADIQTYLGDKLAKELGPQARFLYCDVTKEEDIVKVWEEAYSMEKKLDVVFNNAGVLGPVGPIDSLSMQDFDATMAVNVRGMLLGVKHAARLMKPAKKGSIVCTSSTAAVICPGWATSYTISKAAIVALVKNAAAELRGDGIRVNAISPDLVATPLAAHGLNVMGEMNTEVTVAMVENILKQTSCLRGRSVTTLDVANAALYLASDMAGYVTGHNLIVDAGGTTSRPRNAWAEK